MGCLLKLKAEPIVRLPDRLNLEARLVSLPRIMDRLVASRGSHPWVALRVILLTV